MPRKLDLRALRKRGRPRKAGKRYPGGKLKRPSPREIAATMPHRRALGDKAVDQLAENELGRLVLRNVISGIEALAGDYYAGRWRGYVATLAGPRRLGGGHLVSLDCGGCQRGEAFCFCELRKTLWLEAHASLRRAGWPALIAVQQVALHGMECPPERLAPLRLGLSALAQHFGLTPRPTRFTKMPALSSAPAGSPSD